MAETTNLRQMPGTVTIDVPSPDVELPSVPGTEGGSENSGSGQE